MEYRTYQILNSVGGMKVRYVAIGAAALFFLIPIVGHDLTTLYNVEHGYLDYTELANMYLPFTSYTQAYLVFSAIFDSMIGLIIWGIAVAVSRKLAQNATVALPDDESTTKETRYEQLSKEEPYEQ